MNSDNGITKFIFMGDPQCSRIIGRDNDYSQWSMLLWRALIMSGEETAGSSDKPLLVLGGDLINRSDGEAAWNAFFEAVDASAKGIPMATVVNGSEESAGLYANRFVNPGNGPAGYEKEFFSFDYGCCHFIFLNSDYMGNRSAAAVSFISDWIRADLTGSDKPACFAVMHHPFYTVGSAFDDDVRAAAMRENYLELLRESGVDFILCGHQHVYCRTAESEDGGGVTQVMGISGTKYFDAPCKSNMAEVAEYVSVATLFETDGETIWLRTIDRDGNLQDEYEKQARRLEGVSRTAENTVRRLATPADEDPLKPANKEGLSVCIGGAEERTFHFTDAELDRLEQVEIEYSVMRRSRLRHETYCGFRLDDLLGHANHSNGMLVLMDSRGRQRGLLLEQIMAAWKYEVSTGGERQKVPAMITKEGGSYRLIFGQQTPEQYNGRDWMRDIRQIDVVPPTFYAV